MKTILLMLALLSFPSVADEPVPVYPIDPVGGPYECYAIARCKSGGVACYSVSPDKGGYYCKARKIDYHGVECWTWDANKSLIKHQVRQCW